MVHIADGLLSWLPEGKVGLMAESSIAQAIP
jgi:hypothetical protein